MCNLLRKHQQSASERQVLQGMHDSMAKDHGNQQHFRRRQPILQSSPSMLRNIRALSGSVRILYAVSGSARADAAVRHNRHTQALRTLSSKPCSRSAAA
jgi:hypothetical protein